MLRRRAAKGQKRKADDLGEDEAPDTQHKQVNTLEQAVFGLGASRALQSAIGYEPEQEDSEDENTDDFVKQGQQPLEPVWHDEDDDELAVDITAKDRLRKLRKTEEEAVVTSEEFESRLRSHFTKTYGKPAWASEVAEDDEQDPEVSQLLRSSHQLTRAGGAKLQPGRIDVTRVKDANHAAISQAVVQSVEFHPTAPALLTAGFDKKLRIFQIDGKDNALLHSTFFKDFPIHTARFSRDGNEIVLASRRKYFYVYDLEKSEVRKIHRLHGRDEKSLEKFWISPDNRHLVFSGYDGTLLLVSNKTKQLIGELKSGTAARNVAFSSDGSRMLSSGGDGQVYVWDMSTRDCVHRFFDEGCVSSTSLAIAPGGDYIACGSDAGVVNVYDSSCLRQEHPKPIKAMMNLTTTIDSLHFNHDSQMLGFASRMHKHSMRFAQLPSMSVFSNWPTQATPLNSVHTFDFSPRSGYVAIGNDHGKVLLYRLNHYSSL